MNPARHTCGNTPNLQKKRLKKRGANFKREGYENISRATPGGGHGGALLGGSAYNSGR